MFSATMPPTVERLAKKYLRRPVMVTIGEIGKASTNVEQRIEMLKDSDKRFPFPRPIDYSLSSSKYVNFHFLAIGELCPP